MLRSFIRYASLFVDRLSPWLRWFALALTSFALILGLSLSSPSSSGSSEGDRLAVQLPLSTQGAQILDADGEPVLLRGVNWFGFETPIHVPAGLWVRDYQEMLVQIKSLGYNVIRLPYALESLRSEAIDAVDFNIGANQELQGKTPIEVMDSVIQEADRQGLMILLDSHQLNTQSIPELWYGDGFTEEDWIDTWTMLAERYRDRPNVIGADLKNEPHGRASWGTDDRATDWRLAAERAGNAILEVNPDWLIVVEGVEKNVPGQRYTDHWWGGNLEGARDYPVRLSNPNKLVYSPHEYGPGVANKSWFSEPTFPENLDDRWQTTFNYIATEEIAPIWVGEFGGRQVDQTSKEGIWQRRFVEFIQQNALSFTYWCWNPNSQDTGGILLDDWYSVDVPKQRLLATVLSDNPSAPNVASDSTPTSTLDSSENPAPTTNAIPTPNPTPTTPSLSAPPSPTPNPTQTATNLQVQSLIQSDWDTGFCVSFQVNNPGSTDSSNWQLTFQMKQAEINQSWNGTFVRQGDRYTVTPPDWGRSIQPSQVVDVGFCANKLGEDYLPGQVEVMGLEG
ncbi:MAG: cellulase family glycosylhydrolase [Cyanobacteria bacterium CRU_2_1]|nr:cellulase family glycosylhydrolase [Cyanobacteria bacterium RU_5_0]NJR63000.1 cellulase family glycosylhydrolase [Cyanobacteria bacterium CRU_2_1]